MTVKRRIYIYNKESKKQAIMLTKTSGKKVSKIAQELEIRENNL